MTTFRKVHQFDVFGIHAPIYYILYAIAVYLADASHYEKLGCFFQQECDFMLTGLRDLRFEVYVPQGIYFRVLNY